MRVLEDIKKVLESELEKISKKNDINAAELEMATKVVCLLEKISIVEAMEDYGYEDDGYSERRYSNNGYYGPGEMSYNSYRDNSYRGNYSRRRRSSYDDRGYSMHGDNDMLIRKLEGLLQDAQSEKERKAIIDHIEYLKN